MNPFAAVNRLLLVFLGCIWTATALAAPGGDFRALDIESRAKALVVQNTTNVPLDVATRADAERLLRQALRLQLRVENGDERISPARLRSMESAIDGLQERIAASDAKTAPKATTATALIQGHVFPAPNTAGINVVASDFSSRLVSGVSGVASDGTYSFTVPAPGTYTLFTPNARNFGYLPQHLGGLNCVDSASAGFYYLGNMLVVSADGTFVQVTPTGAIASGLDFTMAAGGSISGTVLAGASPVAGVAVRADIGTGFPCGGGGGSNTDSNGHFVLNGLPAGQYVISVDGSSLAPPLQDTAYPNVPCGEVDCAQGPQNYIAIGLGQNLILQNPFSVGATPSSVSGTVVDTLSNPIAGAAISLISEDSWTYDSGNIFTDASGAYTFPQVRPANYRIVVMAPGYLGVVWPNVTCMDPNTCDPIGIGSVVVVGNGVAMTGKNFTLSAGASVSGTVTRASDHSVVAGATVTFTNSVAMVMIPATDASGNYTVTGLPDGVYTAYAWMPTDDPSLNLAPTGLDGNACEGDYGPATCTGAPVTVAAATPLTGVNFAMAQGGSLSGLILDATSGAPAPYAGSGNWRVDLSDHNGHVAAQLFQVSALGFASYSLPPGIYTAVFASKSVGGGWIDTGSNGLPCPRRSCDPSSLLPVVIDANVPVTGFNGVMPRGSMVRGQVLDAATLRPIVPHEFDPTAGGYIAVIGNPPYGGGFGIPDGSGHFVTLQGFAPGTYFSATVFDGAGTGLSPFGAGYVDQAYSGIACPYMTCSFTTAATPFQLGALGAGDVTGINYVLSKGGAITGTVKGSGAVPLNGVALSAFNATGKLVAQTQTNALGVYHLPGLATGSYFVTTTNTLGDIDQLYTGVPCTPICNPVNGTPVAVTAPSATSAIDFNLQGGATISGTVSGSHSANVTVQVYGAIGNQLGSTVTASGGSYSFSNLLGGTYFVRTLNGYGDIDALYSGGTCVGSACKVTTGTPISLSAEGTQSGVNLVLTAPGTISGQVTDNGNNVSGVTVDLYDSTGALAESTVTSAAANGSNNYTLASLATGSYYVVARSSHYIDVSYPNAPCPATTCTGNVSGAIPVAVTSGSASSANFTLGSVPSIGGTVSSGSGPIPGAQVQVYDTNNLPVTQQATDASGHYQFTNLADGTYYLRTQNGQGYLDLLYNGISCSGYCAGGTAILISSGVATPNTINFLLGPGSSISGNVKSGGVPVALVVTVQAYDTNGHLGGSASTDASGHYTISGLNPGYYTLRTSNLAGYIDQVYSGIPCSPTPCGVTSGTPVLAQGNFTVGDIALTLGATLSGIATDTFNNPLPSGTAVLYGSNGLSILEIASTPVANGQWAFNGLANGTYYLLIENSVGLVDELYASVPCPAGSCNIAVGTPIVLNGPSAPISIKLPTAQSTSAIDFALPTGARFTGNVKDAVTNSPIAGATVYFFNSTGTLVGQGLSDGLGNYTSASGLPAGTYYAATTDGVHAGAIGYVNALYNSKNCPLACSVTSGNALSAGASSVNFSLSKGLSFAGLVVDTNNHPLPSVAIDVYDGTGALAAIAISDSLGHYKADGVPAGTYYARSFNNLGLLDVLYGGTACPGDCNVLASAPIVISNASQPQNINFSLILDRIFRNGFD